MGDVFRQIGVISLKPQSKSIASNWTNAGFISLPVNNLPAQSNCLPSICIHQSYLNHHVRDTMTFFVHVHCLEQYWTSIYRLVKMFVNSLKTSLQSTLDHWLASWDVLERLGGMPLVKRLLPLSLVYHVLVIYMLRAGVHSGQLMDLHYHNDF